MPNQHRYTDRSSLDAALAETIIVQLNEGIASRGTASLVVSGGSTPKGLFQKLSSAELDWAKVTVLLADERWVPETHADSNSAMVKTLLLQDKATAASWIDYGAGRDDPEREVARVSKILAEIDFFDVVVLGMGADSHTASLFPCSIELLEGLTTTESVLMTQPTTAPHKRITLSKHRLLKTELGIIHLVGDSKLEVFEKATAHADDEIHPISHFAHLEQFALWFAP
ncbi:MAG: 6-phosphogluconolactonase [Luminiphilus sp.]|nr:6-phosphogluconolactonase [Luminiphilus sp.]